MSTTITWTEIAVRLALTFVAGGLIGLNRGEQHHPAGLRTTILVALAAAISMIQVNLLLPLAARHPDSFVMLDLMRLPLGVLSGMGFIGAGAIMRRGEMVKGVTTAATLWFVTVMGLCFGGGQLVLGIAALVLAIFVLAVLKRLERYIRQDRHGVLTVMSEEHGPTEKEIRSSLESQGFTVLSWAVTYLPRRQRQRICCEVHWQGTADNMKTPAVIEQLRNQNGVCKLSFTF